MNLPAAMAPRSKKRYGWIRDLPGLDHTFALSDFHHDALGLTASLPASVDLSHWCPPVYDQSQLGSCSGQAVAGLIETLYIKQGKPADFTPSRLFIYYYERYKEGTVPYDAGAQIRDGMLVAETIGVCHESLWNYDISQFAVQPNAAATADAAKHKLQGKARLDGTNLSVLKGCLAAGFPYVFGFAVYPEFEGPQVAATGVVPMPGPFEQSVGGHAVLAVGYDDARQSFKVRNSWGAGWGLGGYFWLPSAYMTNRNLAADFWTAKLAG